MRTLLLVLLQAAALVLGRPLSSTDDALSTSEIESRLDRLYNSGAEEDEESGFSVAELEKRLNVLYMLTEEARGSMEAEEQAAKKEKKGRGKKGTGNGNGNGNGKAHGKMAHGNMAIKVKKGGCKHRLMVHHPRHGCRFPVGIRPIGVVGIGGIGNGFGVGVGVRRGFGLRNGIGLRRGFGVVGNNFGLRRGFGVVGNNFGLRRGFGLQRGIGLRRGLGLRAGVGRRNVGLRG